MTLPADKWNSSRECFEEVYAEFCSKQTGCAMTADKIRTLRQGDRYGDRPFLNGFWGVWGLISEKVAAYTKTQEKKTHSLIAKGIREALKPSWSRGVVALHTHADWLATYVMADEKEKT